MLIMSPVRIRRVQRYSVSVVDLFGPLMPVQTDRYETVIILLQNGLNLAANLRF